METNHAISNARAWLAMIAEARAAGKALDGGAESVTFEGEAFENKDDLRERIQEMPLSVMIRRDWEAPGGEAAEPCEYEVLLSTGGPALRIRGGLEGGQPDSEPRLQWQDWGTAWTDYPLGVVERKSVEWFASHFYFEG